MQVAVRIENLSKEYRLGVINNGRLYRDIQSAWARARGKEDPWSKIGEESRFGRRGSFWALKDVSLDVLQGQRLGIIGRNGAGKSTLLKILSRITAPTSGVVKMRGRVTSLLEVGTGFHPELTGRENVFLNGAILGMKKAEIARKFDEIVAFSEIEEFIDTPVKRYSSGMYVRLAFAVAAHLDSEIMVADEVLAIGDIRFQTKCLGKMQDVSENQGRTVLFVSHALVAVKQLCNVGVLLEQGRLLHMETNIENVIKRYTDLIGM
jgi:lipopolysaccharide transport system ATP-binding protein